MLGRVGHAKSPPSTDTDLHRHFHTAAVAELTPKKRAQLEYLQTKMWQTTHGLSRAEQSERMADLPNCKRRFCAEEQPELVCEDYDVANHWQNLTWNTFRATRRLLGIKASMQLLSRNSDKTSLCNQPLQNARITVETTWAIAHGSEMERAKLVKCGSLCMCLFYGSYLHSACIHAEGKRVASACLLPCDCPYHSY